jgi:plasmid stability protein
MAQLIVRKLEDKVVRKLKERAVKYGVSMEEAHRRILRDTLLTKQKPKMSFKEFLVAPPYVDVDLMKYIPRRDKRHRKVDLG